MEEVSCLLLEGGLVPMELNPRRDRYRDVPDGLVHVCSRAPSEGQHHNYQRSSCFTKGLPFLFTIPSAGLITTEEGREGAGRRSLQLSEQTTCFVPPEGHALDKQALVL